MVRQASPGRIVARVATAAAAALLTACSASPAPSAHGSSPEPLTPASLSHALPPDPVRMVLPATGAETRWTQGLDVFVRQVGRTVEASCARQQGIALPAQAPLAFIRYYDLPDLDFIARHGTSESAPVPTPSARPAVAARAGSPAAINRCRTEGRTAADALRGTYAELQGQWFGEVASLRRDPHTLRALRTLSRCLAGHGIQARDENAFFALSDARMQTAAPAELAGAEREVGRAYADCMRPVEAVREPARLRLRARFLADHADEIRELRRTLVPLLHRAEEQHGVRLAFPAP
ncbi:hypothetical protein ACFOZ0_31340 [Streptomyces yaanensis]|uniref:DUF3829 domain-containing protein n=1 Tax=Streptomyces yaanensis TaxID=1142239 RepID=A0ABV7SMJ5_9ACTN|nr:hypothetical protein [Streptomyces sp. CGMCC 4.7035]WNC01966.1 hypothetical protein Q2K21_30060 [Streptomyces sp. CGMCC 4.7035]